MKDDDIRKAFEEYNEISCCGCEIDFTAGYKSRDKEIAVLKYQLEGFKGQYNINGKLTEEIAELKEQIESMYNITTVTKDREKDEYWGYWETCNSCGSSMISESNYCPNCGKRIKRGAE